MSALFARTASKLAAATAVLTVVSGLGLAGLNPAEASAATHVTNTNLLRGHSFTDHGFAKADILLGWEGDGPVETPECGSDQARYSSGFRNSRARMYVGAQTLAEELVVQFRTVKAAQHYVHAYRKHLVNCADYVGGHDWHSSQTRKVDVDGASTALWWTVTETYSYTKTNRAMGVVRSGRRVAVLSLESTTSKPAKTTNVPALLQDAADRLHR